ncbi:hypothetical protein AVEN_115131-1 [Araneus ventricosus]|uniref:Uncharacterized protein n=1 Tax=Araneus ventricosus TaxID=182803 RepID=A0A4Y1ZXX2_ARAVE|nr:hypothetical protein AVEN_115131-1 [Araneus ventricosus]
MRRHARLTREVFSYPWKARSKQSSNSFPWRNSLACRRGMEMESSKYKALEEAKLEGRALYTSGVGHPYSPKEGYRVAVVVSYSTCPSPQLDQVQESARPQKITNQRRTFKEIPPIGERFMVKEESAASVGTRPWTPEGRSLTLSIAFML